MPTLLYYLGVLLAIEADARRHGVPGVELDTPGFWRVLGRWGYHFSSLVLIVVLLAVGFSPFRAVLSRDGARLRCSRSSTGATGWARAGCGTRSSPGARGVLPVAATTAAAGIIVAVVSLTGLGLKLSSIIVGAAGGSLALAALFSAVAVLCSAWPCR